LLSSAAFAGNKKNTGLRIVRYFESLGSSIKSSVDREKIMYDVTVMSDRLEPAVAGMMSAISSPPYAAYVLEEAKEAAALQYGRLAADPVLQLSELIHAAAYGEASPLGGSLFAASLDQVSALAALDLRSQLFRTGNLVVTGSGVGSERLAALLEGYGGGLAVGPRLPPAPSPYQGGEVRVRGGGDLHMALALPTPAGAAGQPLWVLLELLQAQGLHAFLQPYSSGGLLGIYCTEAAQLQSLAGLLRSLASPAAIPGFLAARSKAALARLLALEGKGVASTALLLEGHLTGLRADLLADLRGVSEEAVRQAAAQLLAAGPSLAVLGATHRAPSHAEVAKLFK